MRDTTLQNPFAGNEYLQHGILFIAQLLFFVLIAIIIDVFSKPVFRDQFFGHVGPAILLVFVGALALNYHRFNPEKFVLFEAYAGLTASVLYILIDTFVSHPPLGIFDGAGVAEQQHVGIMFIIGAASLFAIMAHKKINLQTGVHVLFVALIFSMVIVYHHQHHPVATLAHYATAVYVMVAALFRVSGRIVEYGFCLVVAGYVWASSQMGFAMYAGKVRIDAGAYVCYWTALGIFIAMIYLWMTKPGRTA